MAIFFVVCCFSVKIDPFHFYAGYHTRQANLGLFFMCLFCVASHPAATWCDGLMSIRELAVQAAATPRPLTLPSCGRCDNCGHCSPSSTNGMAAV